MSRGTSSGPDPRRHRLRFVVLFGILIAVSNLLQPGDLVGADGLDWACSTDDPDDPPDPIVASEPRVLSGLNIQIDAFFPPGTTVPDAQVDPTTGWLTVHREKPYQLGGVVNFDIFDDRTVTDAGGAEVTVFPVLRASTLDANLLSATAENPDRQLHQLLTQNFALRADHPALIPNPFPGFPPLQTPFTVLVGGIELVVTGADALRELPHGIRVEASVGVEFRRASGATATTRVTEIIDSTVPDGVFPNSTSVGVAFPNSSHHVAASARITHKGRDAAVQALPPLGFGIKLDELLRNEQGSVTEVVPSLTAATRWTHAPGRFAVGLRQYCQWNDPAFRSTAHLGWSVGDLAEPTDTRLDLDVRSGIGVGLPLTLAGGQGASARADEIALDVSLLGVPARFDTIFHPDDATFTRSEDVRPDLLVRRLQLATDDPSTTSDSPLHMNGAVRQLPEHLLARAALGEAGELTELDISGWNLVCDGEVAPSEPATDESIARNLLRDTLPLYPTGCRRHSMVAMPHAGVMLRNWLPDDQRAFYAAVRFQPPAPFDRYPFNEFTPFDEQQFAYYATTADSMPWGEVWTIGGQVDDLERIAFRSQPDSAGASLYWQRASEPAEVIADPALLIISVDDRTDRVDETANSGNHVSVQATVVDLPTSARIDIGGSERSPVDFQYRATGPIQISDGRATLQTPGRPGDPDDGALRGRAQFETSDSDAFPPTGRLEMSHRTSAGRTTDVIRWSPAAPVNDTFPTPTAPAYDPDTSRVRMKVGAEISTRGERSRGLALRGFADLSSNQRARVTWFTEDGSLSRVDASFCAPTAPCPGASVFATLVYGRVAQDGPAGLLGAPRMPRPTRVVAAANPALTPMSRSGLQALLLGPTNWGITTRITGVVRFSYSATGPGPDLSLRTTARPDNPVAQEFRIGVIDVGVGNPLIPPGPSILFADARLSRLPGQIRVKVGDSGSLPSGEPWIWVNTDDILLNSITGVDFSRPQPPAVRLPVIEGTVRSGTLRMLSDRDALAPTAHRVTARYGFDVRARIETGHDSVLALRRSRGTGLDASFRVVVPRHVAVWKPSTEILPSAGVPHYEPNDRQRLTVAARTTLANLGSLDATIDLYERDRHDLRIRAHASSVPGQLDARLVMTSNRRLPWDTYTLDATMNSPIQLLYVDVFDREHPLAYGRSGVSDAPSITANYAVELHDVPRAVHVRAKVLGSEPRIEPPVPDAADVGGELGFAHALVYLDPFGRSPASAEVEILADLTGAGELRGSLESTVPISGFFGARADALSIDRTISKNVMLTTATVDTDVTLDLPLMVEFAGMSDIRFAQRGLTLSIDEKIAAGGRSTLLTIGQRSLPHEPTYTSRGAYYHSRRVAFGASGSCWFIAECWDIGGTTTTESFGDVAIFDWHHCHGGRLGVLDWFLMQPNPDPRLFTACADPRYEQVNQVSVTAFERGAWYPRVPIRSSGWRSADLLLDPIFSWADRVEMSFEEGGLAYPMTEAYMALANLGPAFTSDEIAATPTIQLRTTTWPPVTNALQSIRTRVGRSRATAFDGSGQPPFNWSSASCSSTDVNPNRLTNVAIGSDGTRYYLRPDCIALDMRYASKPPIDLIRGFDLHAVFRNPTNDPDLGPTRWRVRLPLPPGFDEADDRCDTGVGLGSATYCRVTAEIRPRDDGTVTVTLTSLDLGRWGLGIPRTIGSVNAWFDASGHPGGRDSDGGRVSSFIAEGVFALNTTTGSAVLDPARSAPNTCFPQICTSYRWLFGDGQMSERMATSALGPVEHHYPPGTAVSPREFHAELIIYGVGGEVVRRHRFAVR